MSKHSFLSCIAEPGPLFLDGAMGTMLQAAGMPPGIDPAEFCLANPDILKKIHMDYLAAGANIITTCTFGANPFKLPPGVDVTAINRKLTEIARQAAAEAGKNGPLFVAGDVGPSGQFIKPLGQLEPEELISGYMRQIDGLVQGGADLIFMETQFDLAEVRALVAAARRVCDLPVMVSMTFENGVSLTGSSPEIFAETMRNMDCAIIGTNCSLGPDEMLPVIRDLLAVCAGPVMAEPNAGIPVLENNRTVFPLGPEEFAEKTAAFASLGVKIIGGCCGTTPAHIAALVKACKKAYKPAPAIDRPYGVVLTSRSRLVRIGEDNPLAIIGERINPTGKPRLSAQLQDGDFSEAMRMAEQQIKAGANVLDVNVGAPHVDEKSVMPNLVMDLVGKYLTPLSLDSSDEKAIASALPYCPGSFLINSISGEAQRMELLGPLCRQFGAPFILLPLAGKNLPEKAAERIRIIEKLLLEAEALHIPRNLALVDVLALSISASPNACRESAETIRWCCENKLPTTIGLSNISFGLPARSLVNSAYLALMRGAGLSSAIANPCNPEIAATVASIKALESYDRDCDEFIGNYGNWKSQGRNGVSSARLQTAETVYDAVLAGDRENIIELVEKELATGVDPLNLVNDKMLPAIEEVGKRYERKEYFLPQLIRSAETLQKAFFRLKPLLQKISGEEKRPVVIMATVEGDIHDIGKNIVSLMLGNHGFTVIDAGKDVPAEKIVDLAVENNAAIIGLSALMTTTMVRMEDTIKLLKERKLPIRVMVGGAAVTRDFAESIGADAYCEDAVESVSVAKKFTDKK